MDLNYREELIKELEDISTLLRKIKDGYTPPLEELEERISTLNTKINVYKDIGIEGSYLSNMYKKLTGK